MSLTLSNLKSAAGATKKRKTIGRGGKRGSYSCRGIKGQKARSGVSGLKALGLKAMMQSTPKLRGFQSPYAKRASVNIGELNVFDEGTIVDLRRLKQKGLLARGENHVKILGKGQLTKKLVVLADGFSAKAKEAIVAAGGKAQVR